jgi:hypothetical protein
MLVEILVAVRLLTMPEIKSKHYICQHINKTLNI